MMNFDDQGYQLDERVQKHCPKCEREIIPIPRSETVNGRNISIQIVQCPNPNCQAVYASGYSLTYPEQTLVFAGTLPYGSDVSEIPTLIEEKFPDFVRIYSQASISESIGLTEISGMAYRKAAEYLVKLYMGTLIPDQVDEIKSERVAITINRFDEKTPFYALAKATSWLGNDQTHMIQEHPDYGVIDIKSFIQSFCHLIVAYQDSILARGLLDQKKK